MCICNLRFQACSYSRHILQVQRDGGGGGGGGGGAIVKPLQDNEHKFLAVFPTTLLVYRSAIYQQGMTFKCGLGCGLIMVVSISKLGSWPSYRRITYSRAKCP